MSELIKVKQGLVIEHDLKNIGKSVTDRLTALNIDGQIATDETIKSMKELRASLNKEKAGFKEQFKIVNDIATAPINAFKIEFKDEIEDKYSKADDTLKTKIGAHESAVKKVKEDNVRSYFNELCQSESIDFLKFEDVGIEINLSTTEKKYKERCNEFVSKVKDEIEFIDTNEFKLEIMVEYRKTINITVSIKTVQERKRLEEDERIRLEKQKHISRSNKLIQSGLIADKETESYVYSDTIYVGWDGIKDLPDNEFTSKLIELQELIREDKKQKTEALKQVENITTECKEVQAKTEPIKKPEILSAPIVKTKLEIVNAKFEVSGTFAELKKLGEYMRSNNLTYKNLKNE